MSFHKKVSLDVSRSRRCRLELEKAMSTARCPKDSKFGECLININTKQDPILGKNLSRIEMDIRRMEAKMQQLRKTFVRSSQCLNYEPMILVERCPPREAFRRTAFINAYGYDPQLARLPGYMFPMKSRSRTPTTFTTIDAFVVKQRRTRNVWERATEDKELPKFESTVRPCSRLTQREIQQLQQCRTYHKPKLQDERELRSPRFDTNTPFISHLPRTTIPQTVDGRLSVMALPSSSKSLFLKEPGRSVRLNETPISVT
ncbi:uncharacterized protein LOC121388781 [Gigantopelta aegis]|uniref:uncharacterized protein LOC121388781 n=1 Tax=Gigantopelta aegis TaxID=1735272 RepID=UPI001B88B7B7|nr:uncharacterized protein LOC121388781 [Gigantopelta aegis]